MATANGIRAGKAFVELSADNSLLQSGLNQTRAMMAAFAKGATLAGGALLAGGTAMLGALSGLATLATDAGSALKDASDRTGIAVEALSGLDYAARMSDTSLDALVSNVFKLQRALAGVSAKKNPFAALGLDADKLKAMKPDEAFTAVADALAKITNPAERNAAAMSVFGKGAAELVPLLASGADGISGMIAEAERLGLVMSAADASDLEAFGDQIETMGLQVKRTFITIGTAVVQAIQPYTTLVSDALGYVTRFANEHRNLAAGVGVAAIGVVVLGGTLIGVGAAAAAASVGVGALATVVGTAGTVLAALVSPAALIAASVGVVGFVLAEASLEMVMFSQAGQQAIGYVSSAFQTGKTIVTSTVGGIASALSNGRIALAGKIAGTGLQLAFATAKVGIINLWAEAMRTVAKLTVDAFTASMRVVAKGYTALGNLPVVKNTQLGSMLSLSGLGWQLAAGDLSNEAKAAIDLGAAAFKTAETEELKKQIEELKKQLDTLRGDASQAPDNPTGSNQYRPQSQPPAIPEIDVARFAPKVIGGFSGAQIAAQTNALGLADPLKSLVAKAETTNGLLSDIADNTEDDDFYYE